MQVRVMRVLVPHWLVLMPVRVRFGYGAVVVVLVMIVVDVTVLVFQRVMKMLVLVPFGKVEPKP